MMLYIFDKDWTIVKPDDGGTFINRIDQQILMDGVAEKCQELKNNGHKIAVASNQGGVAFGYMDYKIAMEIVAHAAKLINADAYDFCPHHPKGNVPGFNMDCDCRKPNPGLLLKLITKCDETIDTTYFIGDLETDQEAAKNAGVKFIWAKDFFDYD